MTQVAENYRKTIPTVTDGDYAAALADFESYLRDTLKIDVSRGDVTITVHPAAPGEGGSTTELVWTRDENHVPGLVDGKSSAEQADGYVAPQFREPIVVPVPDEVLVGEHVSTAPPQPEPEQAPELTEQLIVTPEEQAAIDAGATPAAEPVAPVAGEWPAVAPAQGGEQVGEPAAEGSPVDLSQDENE